MILDWNHVYLLGWYDQSGRGHLTTWYGDRETTKVIVTGPMVKSFGPPLWKSPTLFDNKTCPGPSVDQYTLHEIPDGFSPQGFARRLNGVVAIGWYIPEGFVRRSKHDPYLTMEDI